MNYSNRFEQIDSIEEFSKTQVKEYLSHINKKNSIEKSRLEILSLKNECEKQKILENTNKSSVLTSYLQNIEKNKVTIGKDLKDNSQSFMVIKKTDEEVERLKRMVLNIPKKKRITKEDKIKNVEGKLDEMIKEREKEEVGQQKEENGGRKEEEVKEEGGRKEDEGRRKEEVGRSKAEGGRREEEGRRGEEDGGKREEKGEKMEAEGEKRGKDEREKEKEEIKKDEEREEKKKQGSKVDENDDKKKKDEKFENLSIFEEKLTTSPTLPPPLSSLPLPFSSLPLPSSVLPSPPSSLLTSSSSFSFPHPPQSSLPPLSSSLLPPSSFPTPRIESNISEEDINMELKRLENEDLSLYTLEEQYQSYVNMNNLDSESLQDKFNSLKHLLQILGIPYVDSPSEAEAQCAFLESKGLVDGIITEDSDVFLFGGRKVYRGVFRKKMESYEMVRVEKELGLGREKLVLLAMFLGSDYTIGIKGVR